MIFLVGVEFMYRICEKCIWEQSKVYSEAVLYMCWDFPFLGTLEYSCIANGMGITSCACPLVSLLSSLFSLFAFISA